MIRILMDILGVILWCNAVYVCAFDWNWDGNEEVLPDGNTI